MKYRSQPKPLLHRNAKFLLFIMINDCSFKGKNPVTWLQAKSPLSFVFSSAFIRQLTKSLLEVCFGFIYLHFNKFRAHLLQGSFCLELYFAPFLLAAYSCDHSAYKNSISPLRAYLLGYFTTLRPHLRDAHTSYDFLQPPFCF